MAADVIRPTALDVLRAQRGLALAADYSDAERRVGISLLEHYNLETGRCDPSIVRLADLNKLDRATVFRAVTGLTRLGEGQLFARKRFGGRGHRNTYEPNWQALADLDSAWRDRFAERSHESDGRTGATVAPVRRSHGRNGKDENSQKGAGLSERSHESDGRTGATSTVAPVRPELTLGTDSAAAAHAHAHEKSLAPPVELDDAALLAALIEAAGRDRETIPAPMHDLRPARAWLADGYDLSHIVSVIRRRGKTPGGRRAVSWAWFDHAVRGVDEATPPPSAKATPLPPGQATRVWVAPDDPRRPRLNARWSAEHGGRPGPPPDRRGGWEFPADWIAVLDREEDAA